MAEPALARQLLTRAAERLGELRLYPEPVCADHVRLISSPALFRLPWLRRFDGYATWRVVLVRAPLREVSVELVTHELCHVWQMQHHPLRMPLSYVIRGYERNPYELEARHAAAITSRPAAPRPPAPGAG